MRGLKIFGIAIGVLIALSMIWYVAKPATVEYRDLVEMNIGATKFNIIDINKTNTFIHFSYVDMTFSLINDGKIEALPDSLKLSVYQETPINNRPYQKTLVKIDSSPTVSPGNYQLNARMNIHGFNIGSILFTLRIKKNADDIVQTISGPSYRANSHLPGEQTWPLINEKTILVGQKKLAVTYRDSLDLGFGDYKGEIVTVDTTGTTLEGKQIKIGVGSQRVEYYPINNPNITKAVIGFSSSWIGNQQPGIRNWYINIESPLLYSENVPIMVNMTESGDDMIGIPFAGTVYRATGGFPWKPIQWKKVSVPSFLHD